MPRRTPHKYPLPMNPRRFVQAVAASLVALLLFSCEEYPPYAPGMYPRAAPAGWWDDEGASGSSKIVVHVGEQKAYFYKGKRLVGETTVSTGKPGFSTPPRALYGCLEGRWSCLDRLWRLRGRLRKRR